MSAEIVRLDSVEPPESGAKLTTDANANDVLEGASVESGYGGGDDASSVGGSVASLSDAAAPDAPTEEEREAWIAEIAKIEEEAATLRLVLQAKVRRATDLKRKLGITQFDDVKAEVNSILKDIQESSAYAKTSATLQIVSQKTTAAVSSAVNAFKSAATNSDVEVTGPPKVSNTIFRDASGKISSAVSSTGTYMAQTAESVKASPTMQAVGASVSSGWTSLKSRVVGGGATTSNDDSFLGDVASQAQAATP